MSSSKIWHKSLLKSPRALPIPVTHLVSTSPQCRTISNNSCQASTTAHMNLWRLSDNSCSIPPQLRWRVFCLPRLAREGWSPTFHPLLIYPLIQPSSESIVDVMYSCDIVIDHGGWIVIQRRTSGDVDFYRGWKEHKNGFGDLSGDFWFGNDRIHNGACLQGDVILCLLRSFCFRRRGS